MILKKVLIISFICIVACLPHAACEEIHNADTHIFNLPGEIVQALRSGDSKVISKYFNSSVELIFSESQGVYGKAQAEQILKTFFNNNASANGEFTYTHLHDTNKDNAKYYIGELRTGKGLYRVYIYMKDQRIHQMRIESND